eukprot:gnl/MRDRNA2_/MRDRNA2_55952_c0_seq2.p1 gnl/MRDRNA2_/MRDRNA2_55952_c0~~gnl/MRDRNA2_/MRDRNA2_55952_c0_seq2.p1  ORF type:complete len:309 (+),score=36.22 gnl/MRDRNA2_/MRDRNA2_55952_c0_seq2:119-1045(+)
MPTQSQLSRWRRKTATFCAGRLAGFSVCRPPGNFDDLPATPLVDDLDYGFAVNAVSETLLANDGSCGGFGGRGARDIPIPGEFIINTAPLIEELRTIFELTVRSVHDLPAAGRRDPVSLHDGRQHLYHGQWIPAIKQEEVESRDGGILFNIACLEKDLSPNPGAHGAWFTRPSIGTWLHTCGTTPDHEGCCWAIKPSVGSWLHPAPAREDESVVGPNPANVEEVILPILVAEPRQIADYQLTQSLLMWRRRRELQHRRFLVLQVVKIQRWWRPKSVASFLDEVESGNFLDEATNSSYTVSLHDLLFKI